MRVVLRGSARRDLIAIGDWIARDNPARAITFVDEIERTAASLCDMALRHPVASRTGRGPVRKAKHGQYLLYYRVLPDEVEVIAIRHARRDASTFD